MESIKAYEKIVKEQLDELNQCIGSYQDDENHELQQTQSNIEALKADRDKNLDKIIAQQAHVKMIIERDGRIRALREQIANDKNTIDQLRKFCARLGLDALQNRNELLEEQAKELEKFQVQQLKSIADDYARHQSILERRKKEIETVKKEVELEEKNREAYLADVEKNLERDINSREQMNQFAGASVNPLTAEVHDPNYIELTSVDEFAPYGRVSNGEPCNVRGGRGRRKRKTQS